MRILRRFLVAAVVPAMILSVFAVGAVNAHGSAGKVEICHWANHKFVKISVSKDAEPAHLRHGDMEADEYGDCAGDNQGTEAGNGGPSVSCKGARAKSSHVLGSWMSSGKDGKTGQGSGDKGKHSD